MFVFGFALSPPQGYRASSVSSVAFPLLAPNGTAAAPSLAASAQATTGVYFSTSQINFSVAGTGELVLGAAILRVSSDVGIGWSSGAAPDAASDVVLVRDAANTLALKNGENAQTLRFYGAVASPAFCQIQGTTGGGMTIALAQGVGANSRTLTVSGDIAHTPGAWYSGGPNNHWLYTGPADLAMTASTELVGGNWNSSATRQWATGALTLQREFLIQAPTYAFVGASTLTDAVTLAVSGPPVAGTNATLTRAWIATFGTLEAPSASVGTAGAVGVFGAGQTYFIVRDTTNNHEAHISAGTDRVRIGSSSSSSVDFIIAGATGFQLSSALITITDAYNFAYSGTTGTKHGTATTQKQAWWNATPVVQGAAVADASGGATIDAEARTAINTLLARMRTYGLIAT